MIQTPLSSPEAKFFQKVSVYRGCRGKVFSPSSHTAHVMCRTSAASEHPRRRIRIRADAYACIRAHAFAPCTYVRVYMCVCMCAFAYECVYVCTYVYEGIVPLPQPLRYSTPANPTDSQPLSLDWLKLSLKAEKVGETVRALWVGGFHMRFSARDWNVLHYI